MNMFFNSFSYIFLRLQGPKGDKGGKGDAVSKIFWRTAEISELAQISNISRHNYKYHWILSF